MLPSRVRSAIWAGWLCKRQNPWRLTGRALGFSTSTFDLSNNLSGDQRAGLDDRTLTAIRRIMERENVPFDEARLLHLNSVFRKNGAQPAFAFSSLALELTFLRFLQGLMRMVSPSVCQFLRYRISAHSSDSRRHSRRSQSRHLVVLRMPVPPVLCQSFRVVYCVPSIQEWLSKGILHAQCLPGFKPAFAHESPLSFPVRAPCQGSRRVGHLLRICGLCAWSAYEYLFASGAKLMPFPTLQHLVGLTLKLGRSQTACSLSLYSSGSSKPDATGKMGNMTPCPARKEQKFDRTQV